MPLVTSTFINAQLGIGKKPVSLLDVVSDSDKFTKAIKISDSNGVNVFNLFNNGNIEFTGSFMPNDNPGEQGDFLISNGNLPPQWKSIVPLGTKQLYEVFNITSSGNSNVVNANSWQRFKFKNLNLIADPNIGVWNSTNNEFKVSQSGIFYISAGISLDTSGKASNGGNMRICTPSGCHQFNGIVIWDNNVSFPNYFDEINGEIVVYLESNSIISVDALSSENWKNSAGYFHIKYSKI